MWCISVGRSDGLCVYRACCMSVSQFVNENYWAHTPLFFHLRLNRPNELWVLKTYCAGVNLCMGEIFFSQIRARHTQRTYNAISSKWRRRHQQNNNSEGDRKEQTKKEEEEEVTFRMKKDFVGNEYVFFCGCVWSTAESRGKQWILAQHNDVSASFWVSYFWNNNNIRLCVNQRMQTNWSESV